MAYSIADYFYTEEDEKGYRVARRGNDKQEVFIVLFIQTHATTEHVFSIHGNDRTWARIQLLVDG